jgi:hypothetical protein
LSGGLGEKAFGTIPIVATKSAGRLVRAVVVPAPIGAVLGRRLEGMRWVLGEPDRLRAVERLLLSGLAVAQRLEEPK